MDSILNTNADSNLLQTLWQNELSQPFKYKIVGNFCNTSRTYNKISPTFGPTLASGIHGTVVDIDGPTMLLQIGENVKVKFEKSAVVSKS